MGAADNKTSWYRTTAERVAFVVALSLVWGYAVELSHQSISAAPFVSRSGQPMVKWCRSAAAIPGDDNLEVLLGYLSAVFGGIALGLAIFAVQSDADPLSLHRRHSRNPKDRPRAAHGDLDGVRYIVKSLDGVFVCVLSCGDHHSGRISRYSGASRRTFSRQSRVAMDDVPPSATSLGASFDYGRLQTAMPLAVIGAIVGEFVARQVSDTLFWRQMHRHDPTCYSLRLWSFPWSPARYTGWSS